VGNRKCIIIGAGLAGLAAAYQAVQKGWEVDVLEADKRYGGRVHTEHHLRKGHPPLVYELGGEWIGAQHTRMIELTDEFNLPRMDHRYALSFWQEGQAFKKYPAGAFPFPSTIKKKFDKFCNQVRRHKNDDTWNKKLDLIDWWTRLKEMGFSQTELGRRDLMDSTDSGESSRHTSAYSAATEYAFSNKFDEMDQKIVGGNSRLSDAFVRAINAKRTSLHKNQEVAKIKQENGMVKVTTRAGKKFEGNACICAIPASCLNKIHWDPPLSEQKRNAAEELQYARIAKTAVLFHNRFWDKKWRRSKGSGFSMFSNRVSDFCFESTFGQEGPEGIICSYAIGDKADDLAHEARHRLADWISGDICEALRVDPKRIKPKIHPTFLHQKAWQLDECVGGAYAFYHPGQWFRVRGALAQTHGQVMFAGEHLSENWQGFMEGAIETGEAAAKKL
jgi:monoamine oxidase